MIVTGKWVALPALSRSDDAAVLGMEVLCPYGTPPVWEDTSSPNDVWAMMSGKL
jgi:hypothetical protein